MNNLFIVLHCGGIPFNGNTIKTKSLGGSETAAYYMAKELSALGHKVTLATNCSEADQGEWDGVRYIACGIPSQENPLGDRFHFYAENTPHDVLIVQRAVFGMARKFASKFNFIWMHDLALLRYKPEMESQLWNIDGVLCVSEFHKKQVCEVYGIPEDFVFVVRNGVELEKTLTPIKEDLIGTPLVYSSRPERGLEHLVCPGGIMDKLLALGTDHHLYVCSYDNTTPQMAPYYHQLWAFCDALPNVTRVGSLTKGELYDLFRRCKLMVYPTNFEEVSCITAMECAVNGLPLLSSDHAVLPETTKDMPRVKLLALKQDGTVDVDAFVTAILNMKYKAVKKTELIRLEQALSWKRSAESLLHTIEDMFVKGNKMSTEVDAFKALDLIHDSDIFAAKHYLDARNVDVTHVPEHIHRVLYSEMNKYNFAFEENYDAHYKKYYTYEADRGVVYGAEDLSNNTRFRVVSNHIASLSDNTIILDYGCAHGHYTINLAKRFPHKTFIGIDITERNLEAAEKWCEKEGIKNVYFILGDATSEHETLTQSLKPIIGDGIVSGIIAAEVLEHVTNPHTLLGNILKAIPTGDKIKMILTTPYGAWEAQGYKEHDPFRAHVHHFTKNDLYAMFSELENFNLKSVPCGKDKNGDVVGSFITTFDVTLADANVGNTLDKQFHDDHLSKHIPRQSLTMCMLVKDAETNILRCLKSVEEVIDELIIRVDETTSDKTVNIIEAYTKGLKNNLPAVKIFKGKSPLEIGFDAARNETLKHANGDWIMWMDADERMIHPTRIKKYLRNSCWEGYAIQQHHVSSDPVGKLTTDLPVRLFRNHRGISFFGVVHEHPEKEMNKGIGKAILIGDVSIIHDGYDTEEIRRKRFSRNIGLMARDRETYPERTLGKFLWIRDLAHMCRFELEVNGGVFTDDIKLRCKEGLKTWENMLVAVEDGAVECLRYLAEALPYCSELTQILGSGEQFNISLQINDPSSPVRKSQPIKLEGILPEESLVMRLVSLNLKNQVQVHHHKYL